MKARDERWEGVYGFVEAVGEEDFAFVRFHIGIDIGQLVYLNVVVSPEELETFPRLYKDTLNKMVKDIDYHMHNMEQIKRWDKREDAKKA